VAAVAGARRCVYVYIYTRARIKRNVIYAYAVVRYNVPATENERSFAEPAAAARGYVSRPSKLIQHPPRARTDFVRRLPYAK